MSESHNRFLINVIKINLMEAENIQVIGTLPGKPMSSVMHFHNKADKISQGHK